MLNTLLIYHETDTLKWREILPPIEIGVQLFLHIYSTYTAWQLIYNETDTLKWRGDPPRVEILYDSSINYLLKVAFHLNRGNTRLTTEAVHDLFVEDLALAQVCYVSIHLLMHGFVRVPPGSHEIS
jgi:hypothetical protein